MYRQGLVASRRDETGWEFELLAYNKFRIDESVQNVWTSLM